jgi:hypothetical protein
MKILFVSPIVSRRYCADWRAVCRGLRATVASLSRQTVPDWKIMLVGGDEPDLPAAFTPHVIFVKADLDIDRPGERGRREVDKERKQYCGYVELHKYAPEYVMPLDYDDLVSIRLVEYVSNNLSVDAFVLKSGYVYHDGSTHCQYSRRLYMRTGSNLVIRYRKDLFPTEPSDFNPPPVGYLDWPFVASHIKYPQKLFESIQVCYKIVPFPAVIWRRNVNSLAIAYKPSASLATADPANHRRGMMQQFVEWAKQKSLSRRIDAAFCNEFGCDYGSDLGMSP